VKPEQPALSLVNVSKAYGSHKAIRDINLHVNPGEFVVLLGPSGAGKSTIFKCISQLVRPDSGEVWLDSQQINHLRGNALRLQRRRIGLIFQQFNLVSRLSALQNVLLGRLGHIQTWKANLGLFSPADRQLGLRSLDRVGMLDKAYQRADTLSGGQQQRVAIARVMAQESNLILADEPVASLDPVTSRQVLSQLKDVAAESKMAILCSLHQTDLALEFADRIIAVGNGVVTLNKYVRDVQENELESVYTSKN
jgi:phosphonate transport system ATP-binding protein